MLALSLCLVIASAIAARLSESERIALWRRTHTWPPNWQPESEGYKRLMEEREKEIMQIPDSAERWENWLQYVQGRYVKSFTPLGFQLVETPKHVHEKLAKEVNKGLENWDNLRSEGHIHVIHGPDSKFVDMMPTLREVHHDLLEMHEKWAGGIKLKPTSIYGVRLYENGSTLEMHLDKGYSHVISSIVHIAHEYDNDDEPWPLQIEGHDGKLYEVNLKPGQVCFR